MDTKINIAGEIESRLSAPLAGFIKTAGEAASANGMALYLVGGMVRDLLLKRPNMDIDLVVEGSAIELAGILADSVKGKTVSHHRFNTATVKWGNWSVDFTTSRAESYEKPGALPTVRPGLLQQDLLRRDFTVNAMAVSLRPENYGEMLDLYGGLADLQKKAIRFLHERSFIDDATRIWRAIRYEQRLDFNIEPVTLGLLKEGIAMLDTISGDRIRHELELVLKEDVPEKALLRADRLGVLAKLHSSLRADEWLAEKFRQARQEKPDEKPATAFYLAILAYSLKSEELEQFVSGLNFNRLTYEALRDTVALKEKMDELTDPSLSPSGLYHLLQGYSPAAIKANLLCTGSDEAQRRILFYLAKLSQVTTLLTGEDLLKMGIPSGPRVKGVLNVLLNARLEGKVKTREDEEGMVKELLRGFS